MKFMKTCLKRKILVVLCMLLVSFSIQQISWTDSHSLSDDVKGCGIEGMQVDTSNPAQISGKFTMVNYSADVYPEIWYSTQLCSSYEMGKLNIIKLENTKTSLTELEKKEIKFTHSIPSNLPLGNYSLAVKVYQRSGNIFGQWVNPLGKMGGKNDFLSIDQENSMFIDKTKNNDQTSGPTFNTGEVPVIRIPVKNIGTLEMSVGAKITAYNKSMFYEDKPLLEKVSEGKYNIKPGENKDIDVTLPTFDAPGEYYFNIVFVNDSGVQSSGIVEARYVAAWESAKIVDDTVDYAGGKLSIQEKIVGPAASSNISGVLATIAVYDNDNILLFEDSKDFKLGKEEASIMFEKTIALKQASIIIDYSVKSKGKVLDTLRQAYNVGDIKYQPTPTPTPIPEAEVYFKDIVGTKYEAVVNELFAKGIIKGYEDNTFRPLNKVTRAEFVTMVLKLISAEKTSESVEYKNNFQDVDKSHWAYENINLGFSKNILKGYPDGTFKPNANVSFAEALTVCLKMLPNATETKNMKNWPEDFIKAATSLSLDEDLEYSQNSPNVPAIRGEIAIIIYNLAKQLALNKT